MMKTIWFKKWGLTYFPIHPIGFIITFLTIILLLPVYMAILRKGHSISDDLYQLFIYTTCAAFWWKWIAHKTSI